MQMYIAVVAYPGLIYIKIYRNDVLIFNTYHEMFVFFFVIFKLECQIKIWISSKTIWLKKNTKHTQNTKNRLKIFKIV
jgi:hypothetical protein